MASGFSEQCPICGFYCSPRDPEPLLRSLGEIDDVPMCWNCYKKKFGPGLKFYRNKAYGGIYTTDPTLVVHDTGRSEPVRMVLYSNQKKELFVREYNDFYANFQEI